MTIDISPSRRLNPPDGTAKYGLLGSANVCDVSITGEHPFLGWRGSCAAVRGVVLKSAAVAGSPATATVVGAASRLPRAQDLAPCPAQNEAEPLGGWVSLLVANHTAPVFDAFVTRRAIAAGACEQNPLDKPFVNSRGLYLVTQIGPLIPDALGLWMLKSDRKWMRSIWWLPQMAYIFVVSWSAYHDVKVTY